MLCVEVYESCLNALRSETVPESEEAFQSVVLETILRSKQTLINKTSGTQRIMQMQAWLTRLEAIILSPGDKGLEIAADTLQTAVEKTLGSRNRLDIQRISGDPLPMKSCYINLAVINY